ncbi:carbohydrate binding family 9 domain-containing protein, partial [Gemmatimonadota bacterium]
MRPRTLRRHDDLLTAMHQIPSPPAITVLTLLLSLTTGVQLSAQVSGASGSESRPALAAGVLEGDLRIDGLLNETAWSGAPVIDHLTMIEPVEGGEATAPTRIRVLASARYLIIGVEADDPDPSGIVSTSKARDPELRSEDYIKIVLDPFLDGRTGYIFALNPGGARYDALVARRGEGEDPQWDAVWEAKTARGPRGWSAEIRIPLQSLTFDGSLHRWGFNVERRVERLQEVSRWASPFRDAKIAQTVRAGLLTELPAFDTGLGLT